MRKGISDSGFKRLAFFVRAQTGGDELAATLVKWYTPPGGLGDTLGGLMDFSDGARGYWPSENFRDDLFVVIDPLGQRLEQFEESKAYWNTPGPKAEESFEGDAPSEWTAYFNAFQMNSTGVPVGVMSMSEQEELNTVLGTNYETFEPTEEDIQAWTTGMEGL